MQIFPNHDETISGIAVKLLAGDLSCVALVESCLSRIDEQENEIQAWVSVDRDGALQRARELDEDRAAGRQLGPLHGIPVGIKDIVDVAGTPTAAGSELLAREVVDTDAPLVSKLRTAGAIILGKTVTTQFACFDPAVTRNPWNPEQTPGGSSSGSAAAVACGMCLAAIGSQTGGSITRPASFCGIAGCKPTLGLVSTAGVLPVSPHLDHPGPIARSVADLAIMLDVLVDEKPTVQPWPADKIDVYPQKRLQGNLSADSITAPRIGRLRGFFDEKAEPSALTALDRTLDLLASSGASQDDVTLQKCFTDLHRCHRAIMAADAAAYHKDRLAAHPDDYLPSIRAMIEEGMQVSESDYARCREHQEQTRLDVLACFDDVDVLACPAALGPAPDRSTTGDPLFNSPWSYTGLPTISFPIGLAENGLPVAIQLIGHPYGEIALFRTALWCEQVVRDGYR